MREILFRGKRVDDEEWIKGYLYRISEEMNPFIMLPDSKGESYEVDSKTVGQYTELVDRNGQKIFEDDIVTMPRYGGGKTKSVVYFSGGKFAVNGSNYAFKDICPKNMNVVGNIYDNPELLKEGATNDR